MSVCGYEGCRQIGIALDEAMINAIYHGNLELPRDKLGEVWGQLRDSTKVDLIEERRSETPYCQRRVFIDAAISPVQVEI